ncbi:MAG: YggT family protein [Treponemataceae bacterium]|nr:YggT family protein [Treponemataceae bacterium]
MYHLFNILTDVIVIYMLLCVIRVFLTWIPGLSHSPFGRFLSAICDPFLNLFSRIRWLHFGAIDFSPIVAIVSLSTLSSFIFLLLQGVPFSLALILIEIIRSVWAIISYIIFFFIIIVAARLIVALVGGDKNSSLWNQIDSSLSPLVYAITKPFSGGRPVAYRNALVFVLVLLIALNFGGKIAVSWLIDMCHRIPF